MPMRPFRGTRPGSGRPTAAIEQAGSPTASASAIRWAAAVAAGEVYHVVVTRLPPPVVGVGPGDMTDGADTCFEGAGRVVGVRVGAGRAGDAGCSGVAGFGGGSGMPGFGGGSGVADFGGGADVADFGGGADVADFGGGADVACFGRGSGVADLGGGLSVPGFAGGSDAVGRVGGSGVVGRGEGAGVREPGEGRDAADRVGGGGVVGPASGVRRADAPVAVRPGTGRRLGGAGRVVGR